MDWLGSAIGAGGSLLGGLIGQKHGQKMFKKQVAAQKQFAQHGIRWKAADARAAGISPLAALGASTSTPGFSITGDSLGDGIASAAKQVGSHISGRKDRALSRMRTSQAHDAALEESSARTESLRAEAARHRAEANDTVAKQYQASMIRRLAGQLRGAAGYNAIGQDAYGPSPDGPRSLKLPSGRKFKVGEGAPAEDWQREYGEVGEMAIGTYKGIKDWLSDTIDQISRNYRQMERDMERRMHKKRFPDRSK